MKHYVANYIINPVHRITVDLIGAGGTGSQMLQSLARIDCALYKLGHPGLYVRVFDADIVTDANIGRQLFSARDTGLDKAERLVTRVNRFYGLDWESVSEMYPQKEMYTANITISCVDTAKARIDIGKYLREKRNCDDRRTPYYWLDFGNQQDRGQVVLGTIRDIAQPKGEKDVAKKLKCVDKMFNLSKVREEDSGPSCSLAEALRKQDLFINSTLCQFGSALLWKMFTGVIDMQGVFLNLKTMRANPITIKP